MRAIVAILFAVIGLIHAKHLRGPLGGLRDCVRDVEDMMDEADQSEYESDAKELETALSILKQKFECVDVYEHIDEPLNEEVKIEAEALADKLFSSGQNLADARKTYEELLQKQAAGA